MNINFDKVLKEQEAMIDLRNFLNVAEVIEIVWDDLPSDIARRLETWLYKERIVNVIPIKKDIL